MNTHLWIGQHARTDELNERIQARQFPDNPLAPSFDPRPCQTKYCIYPALDNRPLSSSSKKSPLNIDLESILKNQTVRLQRGSNDVYVPSSSSDLYKINISSSSHEQQPFPNLFKRPSFTQSSREQSVMSQNIGKNRFSNATRIQLKNENNYKN